MSDYVAAVLPALLAEYFKPDSRLKSLEAVVEHALVLEHLVYMKQKERRGPPPELPPPEMPR